MDRADADAKNTRDDASQPNSDQRRRTGVDRGHRPVMSATGRIVKG
jgi:hypothetical protein